MEIKSDLNDDFNRKQSNTAVIYDKNFFVNQVNTSYKSAQQIIPIILEIFKPKSVIDIGSGAGGWLYVFKEYGIDNIFGYDASDLKEEDYLIDKKLIATNMDFSNESFRITHKADLLISLEVAEHLPLSAADNFIKELTKSSDIIIFSAAFPYQGGLNHFNEQPSWYWREKFETNGYLEIDFIRHKILHNKEISWWYKQNITCYAKKEVIENSSDLIKLFDLYSKKSTDNLTVINERILRFLISENRFLTKKMSIISQREKILNGVVPKYFDEISIKYWKEFSILEDYKLKDNLELLLSIYLLEVNLTDEKKKDNSIMYNIKSFKNLLEIIGSDPLSVEYDLMLVKLNLQPHSQHPSLKEIFQFIILLKENIKSFVGSGKINILINHFKNVINMLEEYNQPEVVKFREEIKNALIGLKQ